MFRVVDEHVFPFLRALNGDGTACARHMRDARLQIPSPALLDKVVQKLDALDMGNRDTKGDVYDYMLGKIATAGQNGQFRRPRHIIALMVELTKPDPGGHHLRSSRRHLRLPGGGRRVSSPASQGPVPR